jgi:hypothetical protein
VGGRVLGSFRRAQSGQATVELALSSVVLVLLLLGILDLARVFYFAVRLQDAAREGARVGSVYNPQLGTWPNMSNSSVKSAVDVVLQQSGMAASTYPSSGASCPATKDGNSSYDPPYADSAFPTGPSQAYLYICWNNTAGQAPPVAARSPLNVIVLYRFGLVSAFLQNQFGPSGLELYGEYQATVQ